jgi:FMN-dependent dehydrogenase
MNGLNAPTADYSRAPDSKPLPYYFASAILAQETPAWDDIAWIRDMWKGPLILKGILRADDARRAVEVGADDIVVSNHCAAQPGRRFPTIRGLPDLVRHVSASDRPRLPRARLRRTGHRGPMGTMLPGPGPHCARLCSGRLVR